jgi:hypothetical protein
VEGSFFTLEALLNNVAESVGLSKLCKVNDDPINVPLDKLELLAATFGRAKCTLPFTYLGLFH